MSKLRFSKKFQKDSNASNIPEEQIKNKFDYNYNNYNSTYTKKYKNKYPSSRKYSKDSSNLSTSNEDIQENTDPNHIIINQKPKLIMKKILIVALLAIVAVSAHARKSTDLAPLPVSPDASLTMEAQPRRYYRHAPPPRHYRHHPPSRYYRHGPPQPPRYYRHHPPRRYYRHGPPPRRYYRDAPPRRYRRY
jgi:hypothetical protein